MLEASERTTFSIPAERTEAGVPAFLASALTVAGRDIRAELRSRQAVAGSLVFALLTLVIFNFAFNLEGQMKEVARPGVLWVAIAFAGMMAFGHIFAQEREQGGFEGLLLTPVDRGAVFLGKAAGAMVLTLVLEVFLLPVFALFASVSIVEPSLIVVVLLGSLGYVLVGTLFSAMAVSSRSREMLLPLLLLPVATPVLIAGVEGTRTALNGSPFSDMVSSLTVLGAFDVVFLGLCPVLFEYVLEEMSS